MSDPGESFADKTSPYEPVVIPVGVAVHLVVLLLPVLLAGQVRQVLEEPALIAFCALSSWFCLADVLGSRYSDLQSRRGALPSWKCYDRWSHSLAAVTAITVLAIFWTALLEGVATSRHVPVYWSALGASCIITGGLLRWTSFRQLGEFFISETAVRRDQPLVQRGVFRWIRHPSEAGLLLVGGGAALFVGSFGAATAWLLLLLLVLYRVRREDRFLLAAYGAEFGDYRRRVRSLVPFVY